MAVPNAGAGAAAIAGASGMSSTGGTSAAAAGGAGQAPAAAGSGALPPPPVPAPLRWSTCGSFDCATLEVPLDYAAPSGERIQLSVQRRAARGQRLGSLLINPGGPGGSAIDFLAGFAAGPGARLLDRFDLVAFDPRGVGHSTPINCHSTLQRLIAADPTPDSEAEWSAIDQVAAAFAADCGDKHAKLLPHLGTPDVARDMDQVRAALGEEKLTYLGFSYGTELGAWYAELFPDRVRALVLDGALDLKLSSLEIALQQSAGFESSLASFFEWCAAASSNCRWTQGKAPAAAFTSLSAAVDTTALAVRGGNRKVGPGEFLLGVIAPLYSGVQGYRPLSDALAAAAGNDGSALLAFVDSYTERHSDGTYGNIQEANNAVNCLDAPVPPYTDLRNEVMRFAAASPTFGVATLTSLLVCSHWPVHATKPEPPMAAGAAPILVIGTTGDPATPYPWAEALATELESGVLLTYEGEGHTAYGRGVKCIDDAVNAYLIDGTLPAKGKRCGSSGAASAEYIAPSRLRL
jgi:pimeloyl-ACP methyl ester carboxylesterase